VSEAAIQLSLGGADRLVEALETGGSPLSAPDAGRMLFALQAAPAALVRRLVGEVIAGDARLVATAAGGVGLAAWGSREGTPIETARFTVVDLETTGVGRDARIVEIGAVRVVALECAATFERLVDPGIPLPGAITALTGIAQADLRTAEPMPAALRAFLAFTGPSVLVAHNAPFDVGFLDRALLALEGRRLAVPVLDTAALARRLLHGRLPRFDLASLASRFDTTVAPCHRALPDARATAEVLIALLGRAQERGARTVEDAIGLAAAAPRRARRRRRLAEGLPDGPGVYVMRDARGQALYVGKARDLRARARSYFGPRRQRPAVEAALLALDRIDGVPLGSELEAALVELELIRAFRPPGNARSVRPDRSAYLRLGLADPVPALGVRDRPRPDGALYAGPFRSRRVADEAAAALRDAYGLRTCRPRLPVDDGSCLRGLLERCHAPCRGQPGVDRYADAVERLREHLEGRGPGAHGAVRARIAELVAGRRFEEARRQGGRLRALESVDAALAAVRRAKARSGLMLAADLDAAGVRVLAVHRGILLDTSSVPRRGDPATALGPALEAVRRAAAEGPAGLDPQVRDGPWLPAEHAEAAQLLAAALSGTTAGVVAVPLPVAGAPAAAIVRRVAEARTRVPVRPPLGRGVVRPWRELRPVEPVPGRPLATVAA
jgi:DNA polymerase-3 subunit epsilon